MLPILKVSLSFIDQISRLIDSHQEGAQLREDANGVDCRSVKGPERRGGVTLYHRRHSIDPSLNEMNPPPNNGVSLYFWGDGNSRPQNQALVSMIIPCSVEHVLITRDPYIDLSSREVWSGSLDIILSIDTVLGKLFRVSLSALTGPFDGDYINLSIGSIRRDPHDAL